MLLVREVFHCRPGKVRPLVEKFQAMSKLGVKAGMPPMRILTDLAGPATGLSLPRWRYRASASSRR